MLKPMMTHFTDTYTMREMYHSVSMILFQECFFCIYNDMTFCSAAFMFQAFTWNNANSLQTGPLVTKWGEIQNVFQ